MLDTAPILIGVIRRLDVESGFTTFYGIVEGWSSSAEGARKGWTAGWVFARKDVNSHLKEVRPSFRNHGKKMMKGAVRLFLIVWEC